MALTIAWEGIGVIANASSVTESIGTGTNQWNEDGSGTDSWTTDTFLQGGECFAGAYSNKSGQQYYRTSTAYNFGSGGNAEGQLIYVWVNCPTIGLLQTKATKGLAIRIGTSLTAYNDYTVAGSDDSNGWLGDWKCFVIDPTKTATATGGGGATITNINYIGVWIDTSAIARGDNIFIDTIAIGKGLRVTGTSTTGWQDIKDYASAYATRAWGVYDAREKFFGKIYIGSSAQTAITQFSDTGQTIQFGDCEYWSGSAWVSSLPVTAHGIVIEDATGFRTEFKDGVIVGTDNGRAGSTFSGNSNENVSFNASGLTNAASFLKMYATTFKGFKGGIKLHNDADSEFFGGVITTSGQFDPAGAPSIRNCIFSATTDSYSGGLINGAALLWNSNTDIQDCQFIANVDATSNPHGIEHPAAGSITYTGLTFSGNDKQILFTAASGNLNITATGGTNASNTITDHTVIGIGTITVSNPITLTLTDVIAGSEIHILKADTILTADATDTSAYISSSGTSHAYNYNYPPSGYTEVDIHIVKPGYEVVQLENIPISALNQSVKINQQTDRNYVA